MSAVTILYQDSHFLAVDKPSGLLTIPDGYDLTLPNLKSFLSKDLERVWTIHRLDKETSGVVIFALNADAHRALSILFEARKIHKEYRAFVEGAMTELSRTIDLPLRVNGDRKHRTIVDQQNGKPSITNIYLIKLIDDVSEIVASPQTGYRHQIRAHLAAVGHPVLNDHLYIHPTDVQSENPARLMLHAHKLSFRHPYFDNQIEIISPIPNEMIEEIKKKGTNFH